MKLDKQIEIRIHQQFGLCNALRNKEQYLRIIGTIIQYVTKIEEQNEYTMTESTFFVQTELSSNFAYSRISN